jgi:hypothetical protein
MALEMGGLQLLRGFADGRPKCYHLRLIAKNIWTCPISIGC